MLSKPINAVVIGLLADTGVSLVVAIVWLSAFRMILNVTIETAELGVHVKELVNQTVLLALATLTVTVPRVAAGTSLDNEIPEKVAPAN